MTAVGTGGLLVDTTVAAAGPERRTTKSLILNYAGYLTDGTLFDSDRRTPAARRSSLSLVLVR